MTAGDRTGEQISSIRQLSNTIGNLKVEQADKNLIFIVSCTHAYFMFLFLTSLNLSDTVRQTLSTSLLLF